MRYSNDGNVSIYTRNRGDKRNDELFNGLNKLNLDIIDKKPCLIVKNISHEYALENEQLLKDKYDVKEIV